jgi:hypothetical protein
VNNHASIYFRSFGKNTFINVLYKNRIIYNKSIGKLKINNIKIKKKEKNIKRNLYAFGKEFTDFFFAHLQQKYKIKNISIDFLSKSDNYYTFKKYFFYRMIGIFINKSRRTRKLSYRRNRFKDLLIKEYPYVGRGYKSRGYSPYTNKKKRYYELNIMAKISKMIYDPKAINLISINNHVRYPYNGCKKKKIRKI